MTVAQSSQATQLCANPAIHVVTTSCLSHLQLGCLARKHNMVLVVGLPHKVPCSPSTKPGCPSDGHFQFNTQVAVSEQGNLLRYVWRPQCMAHDPMAHTLLRPSVVWCTSSVYHKTHLFLGEKQYFDTPPWAPELRYFDTSFGVRFGQFICFDVRSTVRKYAPVHPQKATQLRPSRCSLPLRHPRWWRSKSLASTALCSLPTGRTLL